MAPPTTRITLEELRQLAAEVFGVDVRAVTSPFHDAFAIHIGALWSAPTGPHVEYRSIDISLRGLRDEGGSAEGTHAFNVCFDVLEGVLRRRSARPAGQTQGPPSTVRARIAPEFTEALPSEIPPPEEPEPEK